MRLTRLGPSNAAIGVLAAMLAGCHRPPPVVSPAPVTQLAGGYHFGSPATVSVGVGVSRVYARTFGRWDCGGHPQAMGCKPTAADSAWASRWHSDHDVFLIAEPGLRGARLSLGSGFERLSDAEALLTSLRLSLYRRWNTGHVDPGGEFLGVEGAAEGVGDFPLGLRAGVFVRIAGPKGGRRTLLSLDFPIWY